MSEHARLSLSHADTWLNCAAWPRMVEGMGDDESPSIQFGNDSHEILEKLLTEEAYPGNPAKIEESACARVAYDYAAERQAQLGKGSVVLSEHTVSLISSGRKDLWGSADIILYNDDELEIIDLKTGVGTYVDEATSSQLKLYALAAMETLDMVKGRNRPETIKLTIMQPRWWGSEDDIRTYTTTPDELYSWLATVVTPAAAATDDPEAAGTASVRCKQCVGRHICAYRDAAVAEALTASPELTTAMEVTEMAIRNNQSAVVYDNDQLSRVLLLVPVIRDYCDALEEHAKEVIMAGERVPGYKVVVTGGRKKWLDEDAVAEALHKTKIAKSAYVQKLKTPGQVMALNPSKGLAKKLEWLISKGSGGLKLALKSEKGESIAPAFEAIEQKPEQPIPAFLQQQNPVETLAAIPDFLK